VYTSPPTRHGGHHPRNSVSSLFSLLDPTCSLWQRRIESPEKYGLDPFVSKPSSSLCRCSDHFVIISLVDPPSFPFSPSASRWIRCPRCPGPLSFHFNSPVSPLHPLSSGRCCHRIRKTGIYLLQQPLVSSTKYSMERSFSR
jgi:hypothetical protein